MGLGYFFGINLFILVWVLLIYMDFAFFFLVFSWVFISPKFSIEILDVSLDLLFGSGFGVTLTRETFVIILLIN